MATKQSDLDTAGFLLFIEFVVGTTVIFALGQLGFDAQGTVLACMFALNLVTAWFIAKAARARGRSALLYGLASAIPPSALAVFWKLRDRELYGA